MDSSSQRNVGCQPPASESVSASGSVAVRWGFKRLDDSLTLTLTLTSDRHSTGDGVFFHSNLLGQEAYKV